METLSGADSFKDSLKESTLTLIILALFLMTLYIVREGFFSSNISSEPSFEKENIKEAIPIYIQIEGQGVYTFPSGKGVTLKEVLDRSGLEYSTSPVNHWNAKLESGSKIIAGPEMTISVGLMDGEKRLLFHLPIDINQATQEDFEALPGIGKTLARRIVKSRDIDGAFQSADDLKRVYGIGEKKLANIKELITASNGSYEITYLQQHP